MKETMTVDEALAVWGELRGEVRALRDDVPHDDASLAEDYDDLLARADAARDTLASHIQAQAEEVERQMAERSREQQFARFQLEAANQRCDRLGASLEQAEAELARVREALPYLVTAYCRRQGWPVDVADVEDCVLHHFAGATLHIDTALEFQSRRALLPSHTDTGES